MDREVVQQGVVKDERIFDRIRWRARRGLLENDLLLKQFLHDELEGLSAEQLQTLDKLLLLSDNDLLDVLMGRKLAANAVTAALVLRIQNA
ncbi:MAG: succinate dehydrogenase assembly factor 2 [Aeromicrobium sp.]|nr:succinate dehydrogenase assembly factor 2 [Burkholderiales bacterium]